MCVCAALLVYPSLLIHMGIKWHKCSLPLKCRWKNKSTFICRLSSSPHVVLHSAFLWLPHNTHLSISSAIRDAHWQMDSQAHHIAAVLCLHLLLLDLFLSFLLPVAPFPPAVPLSPVMFFCLCISLFHFHSFALSFFQYSFLFICIIPLFCFSVSACIYLFSLCFYAFLFFSLPYFTLLCDSSIFFFSVFFLFFLPAHVK